MVLPSLLIATATYHYSPALGKHLTRSRREGDRPSRVLSACEYRCFSPEGDFTRIVRVPGGLRRPGFPAQDPELHIESDNVLGIWTTDLGVEVVRDYRRELVEDGFESRGS